MSRKRAKALPVALVRAQRRFARWRSTHSRGTRLGEDLWSEAVSLAQEHGHNRTARALGLDYYSLKKRLEASPKKEREAGQNHPSFVEIFPSTGGEYSVELEDGTGAKMRICVKGGGMPDLAALSRGFWREET